MRPSPTLPLDLHYAKANTPGATLYHIANAAGRRICDDGPSTARGVRRPETIGQLHIICIAALHGAIYRSLETR